MTALPTDFERPVQKILVNNGKIDQNGFVRGAFALFLPWFSATA
jgi:hypothetical protein